MLAVWWAFHHFVISSINVYILWFLFSKAVNKTIQAYVSSMSLYHPSDRREQRRQTMAPHFAMNGNDSKQEWGQRILTEKYSWEEECSANEQTSYHTLLFVCTRSHLWCITPSQQVRKIILSSTPVKTAELSSSNLFSKQFLKERYYLREGTKLRKFLFPRWQFHILINNLKAEGCALQL